MQNKGTLLLTKCFEFFEWKTGRVWCVIIGRTRTQCIMFAYSCSHLCVWVCTSWIYLVYGGGMLLIVNFVPWYLSSPFSSDSSCKIRTRFLHSHLHPVLYCLGLRWRQIEMNALRNVWISKFYHRPVLTPKQRERVTWMYAPTELNTKIFISKNNSYTYIHFIKV